ncbi:MAG TPA: exonuclease subunit SbcD [Clostridia bacterium]
MKILHAADLHLGKKLFNVDRIDEQTAVMRQIIDIARENKADLAVIAGDIFDTALPSAAAETLFFESMAELGRICAVVVIAGNHDDPVRLSAAKEMALACNIVLAGDQNITYASKKFQAGNGYIKTEINGQKVCLNILPYPSDSRLGEAIEENTTYPERVKKKLFEGAKGFEQDSVNITVSHLFCAGGVKEGDEREIELGGARLIPLDAFPPAHYTALGHVHKPQTMSKSRNIYYSGSIMPYAFEETAQKSVILADIDSKGVREIQRVPLTKYKPVAKLKAENIMHALELLDANQDKWVWLELNALDSLSDSDTKRIKAFSNLVRFSLNLPEREKIILKDKRQKSDREIFVEFYKSQYGGSEPSGELVNLFLEIMNEL